MNKFNSKTVAALVATAGLVWILFLSTPLATRTADFFLPPTPQGLPAGRLVQLEGSIKKIQGGKVSVLSASPQPIVVYDGERIETGKDSRAVLILNSEDEFEIPQFSSVNLQLWDEKDGQSPVYAYILSGDLTSLKAGLKGRAYIVRDNRLFLPGQKAAPKPLALTVLKSAPLDLQLGQSAPAAMENDFVETEDNSEPTSVQFTSEPETLSNEYIEETLTSRQSQLQKCWLSRLKDRPELKGVLKIQMEISRRGKVKDIKVVDSTLNDEILHNCVLTVLERITFRSFKGPEISLAYPISFE